MFFVFLVFLVFFVFFVFLVFFVFFVFLVIFMFFMFLMFFMFFIFHLAVTSVFFRSMSVEFEELHGVKLGKVGNKEPQVTSPLLGVFFRHWREQRIDMSSNLHKASTSVGNLLLSTLVWVRLVQSLQRFLYIPHLFFTLSKNSWIQRRSKHQFTGTYM